MDQTQFMQQERLQAQITLLNKSIQQLTGAVQALTATLQQNPPSNPSKE